MAATGFKRVLITGDLVTDYHIAQKERPASTYGAAGNEALMCKTPGGASYLAQLVTGLTATILPEKCVELVAPRIPDGKSVSEAYQIWTPFRPRPHHEKADKKDKKVWRVGQFLGCRKGDGGPDLDKDLEATGEDLLVIDDLGLGFADDDQRHEHLKRVAEACGQIVWKTSAFTAASKLRSLLEQPKLRDKTTVVTFAQALREKGARLSTGLSWDQTIEETLAAFERPGPLESLRRFNRAIVRFGLAGVAVLSRQSADRAYRAAKPLPDTKTLELVRFIYDPNQHEGVFEESHDGAVYGGNSLLTAAVTVHLLAGSNYPLFVAGARALAAGRRMVEVGAGKADGELQFGALIEAAVFVLRGAADSEPASAFRCAFPRYVEEGSKVEYGFGFEGETPRSNLLRDIAGSQPEAMAALGCEIVLQGPQKVLGDIPKVTFGKYLTVDREEIERINAFRRSVLAYRANPKDTRPLSVAVFGPPGSGKSFAVKEVMNALFGEEKRSRTYNLSQLRSEEELYAALHEVQSESIRGGIPLVFFDEFDADFQTNRFGWLKYFLAPMQDAEFWDGKANHPLGKAIFVFAGGQNHCFEEFETSTPETEEKRRQAKVPDFISRLRGYINIKGPNACDVAGACPSLDGACGTHLLRRAIIIRHELETNCPRIVDPATGMAAVGLDVVRAALFVTQFTHGARSIGSIISMSQVGTQNRFTMACLPSRDVLRLHVSEGFVDPPHPELTDPALIEALARMTHEAWCERKKDEGYVWGQVRNDHSKPPTHHLLRPYGELAEDGRAGNRRPARLVIVKLKLAGLKLAGTGSPASSPATAIPELLFKVEHDIWVREKLIGGNQYDEVTDDRLRRHRCLQPFDLLIGNDRVLDERIVKGLWKVLVEHGYSIEQAPTT